MEFEKIFEKYIAGTCSEEERSYVEQEMERARVVNETMLGKTPVVFHPADDATVKRAQKRFNARLMLRILGITIGVLLIAAGITLSIIFVPAVQGARDREELSAEEATAIAREYLCAFAAENYGYTGSAEELVIKHRDHELEMRSPRSQSIYVYEFDIRANGIEYDLEVNCQTGEVLVTDVDFD